MDDISGYIKKMTMSRRKPRKQKKEPSIIEKLGPILARLNQEYSSDKTEEDYEKIILSMTSSRDLSDLALKIWRRTLADIEKEKSYDYGTANSL